MVTTPRPAVDQAVAGLDTAVATLKAALAGTPPPPPPAGEVRVQAAEVTSSSVTAVWSTTGAEPASWTVGRDGVDSSGSGPWTTNVPGTMRSQRFNLLRPATRYVLTVTPAGGAPVSVEATTSAGAGGGTPDPGAAHGPRALADGWVPLLVASDDFNGSAVDRAQWSMYTDPRSQHGNRQPSQFSIVADPTALGGRALRVSGTADGKTGGMAHETNLKYGRWSGRMKIPGGDPRWHPVFLTWPDAENWPEGGEIDFAEGKCSTNRMEFFLHYSKDNKQTAGRIDVDVSQWHWYEMSWGPEGVRGWCDGRLFFEDLNPAHSGFGAHHGTIQLDWFPGGATRTGTGEMLVDAYRVYKHPAAK